MVYLKMVKEKRREETETAVKTRTGKELRNSSKDKRPKSKREMGSTTNFIT